MTAPRKRGPRGPNTGRHKLSRNAPYGNQHQLLRKRWAPIVERGGIRCARCGEFIQPGQRWALDHSDHPLAHKLGLYLGPSHWGCNQDARNAKTARLVERPQPRAVREFFNTN